MEEVSKTLGRPENVRPRMQDGVEPRRNRMSKVIHLSEDAHRLAKEFCSRHGLRMSDWVGTLVDEAIAKTQAQPVTSLSASTKKVLTKLRSIPQTDDQGVPIFQKPPFWKEHH
jgi:hypothetical protein